MLKMSLEPRSIKPRRVNRSKIANDNNETVWSDLSFREQFLIKRRIQDLKWQKTFAEIQLNRTQSLTGQRQQAVQALYHRANHGLSELKAFQ